MTRRVELIEECLVAAFEPTSIDVTDDSHLHAGHVGAQDGRGHFTVQIQAGAFVGKGRLERHRMVYDALGSLIKTDIHALRIIARAPNEN